MSAEVSNSQVTEARNRMAEVLTSYDILAAGGTAGSEEEQGFDNWVRTDPREWGNMQRFLDLLVEVEPQLGNNVLMGGCSDGLAALVLAEEGCVPTGFDFSSEMVLASRKRLAAAGLFGAFYQGDATALDLSLYPDNFAGATLIHVAPCIPIAGENDDLLTKAIADVSSRAPDGPLYLSTTYYDDPVYTRRLVKDGELVGEIPYYYRPAGKYVSILRGLGRQVLHAEHFDARHASEDDPGYGYDYMNDYFIAGPVKR